MKTTVINVKAEFTSPLLGTQCSNPNVYSDFIASKGVEQNEITQQKADEEVKKIEDSLEFVEQKSEGMTIFMRMEDGTPCLPMHHITGFLKETIGGLRDNKETECSKITAYKKKISRSVHVEPAYIPIITDSEITHFERPQRLDTPQGERSALANSEMIREGATIEFTISLDVPALKNAVLECLGYGLVRGLGQWRNGGYGKFKVTEISVETEDRSYIDNLPLQAKA